jgi:hypothetical protein
MDTTHAQPAGPQTRLHRAEHAGEAYDMDISQCREVVSRPDGLTYIAHVTSGIVDFAVEAAGALAPGLGTTAAFDRAGRQLSLVVAQLDTACCPLDSGPLIRVVLQGGDGALFQMLKVTGQNFFGLTLDGAPGNVDLADRQLARLAESAVRRIGAASLKWGGFRAQDTGDSAELWLPGLTAPAVAQLVTNQDSALSGSEREACVLALHREDLHYVAVYRLGRVAWSADILDDPALTSFFQRVTPADRRVGYAQVIGSVTQQTRRLTQLLTLVRSDNLMRLVLDVARGAIYILPLNEDDYLVGVTLNQARVEHADRRIRTLHGQLRPRAACEE